MNEQWSKIRSFASILFVCIALQSCEKDEIKPSPETLAINDFIWETLNDVYLWEDRIPQNINRNQEFDTEAYFEKLLYKPTDRWSFITDDYEGLVNSFKGIEESFGHSFKLFLLPGSNEVIGVVKYVIPESPADNAGIKRGDIFYKVNGITINSTNYRELLYQNKRYVLTFGTFDQSGQLNPSNDIALTSEIISENPIHIFKTIELEGFKIGYLSYNQFIADYNDSLVKVMEKFRSDNISELVLDLRYNPGGSISTAILLSSMIAPTSVSQNNAVFSRLIWNESVNQYWLDEEGEESDNLISRFVNPEVSLGLQRIYILVTSNTASASELVINCLDPYMEVVVIGSENTTGKYVGSITVQAKDTDWDNWAMQPIVLKTANANGVSDYSNGFAPDFMIEDDFDSELGTLSEDMLATALELITGVTIADPARLSASYFPKNTSTIQPGNELRKQVMNLDLR
jgi:C-terminal processing protease CtpA/Prc